MTELKHHVYHFNKPLAQIRLFAQMNQQLTQQAAAIGYLNDFKAMAWMALCSLPLLLLFRTESRTKAPVAPPSQAEVDKAKS